MFRFTVEHLGFLAKVPGLPQVFDALLLVTTALRRTPCLVAMEQIETHLRSLPEMRLRPHRLGGTEFVLAGHEIAHLHGNGLLDVRLNAPERNRWVQSGRVHPHHVLLESSWVSLWITGAADVPTALELLETAAWLRASGSAFETPLEPLAKASSHSERNTEQHRDDPAGSMEPYDERPPSPPSGVPATIQHPS